MNFSGFVERVELPAEMPRRLDSLTGARFLAAFGVVLCHGGGYFLGGTLFERLASQGRQGVEFFFILSGFVLTWAWNPRVAPTRFYWLRFSRVWPLHALALLFWIALMGGGSFAVTLSTVTLTQAWFPQQEFLSLNSPSWTLSCEAFFYLMFPFMIRRLSVARSRSLVTIMVAGGAFKFAVPIVVHLVPALWAVEGRVTVILPLVRLPEFIVGICLAVLVKRGWKPTAALVVLASAALAALPVAGLFPSGMWSRESVWAAFSLA